MAVRDPLLRLEDIMEAIDHIAIVIRDVTPEAFENDWQKRWLIERGVEIIS